MFGRRKETKKEVETKKEDLEIGISEMMEAVHVNRFVVNSVSGGGIRIAFLEMFGTGEEYPRVAVMLSRDNAIALADVLDEYCPQRPIIASRHGHGLVHDSAAWTGKS